jgi:hypothetical protein
MMLPRTAIVYVRKRDTAICFFECRWSSHVALSASEWLISLGNGEGSFTIRDSPAIYALEEGPADECAFAHGTKSKLIL